MAKKKKRSKIGRVLYILVILFLVGVIAVCGVKIGQFLMDWHQDKETSAEVQKIVKKSTGEKAEFTHDTWNQLYAQNNDLVGYMIFPDNFCSQPIVQTKTKGSQYYLRRNFVTQQYSSQGTVFMDSKDELSSQNITVYGHHVFYDDTAMFTPISTLIDQNAYDQHHNFKVYYKDDVASYVITNVYTYQAAVNGDYDFTCPDFYDDYTLTQHMQFANDHNEIKPVDTVDNDNDRIFTIQTCKTYHTGERTIVVAKEVSRSKY